MDDIARCSACGSDQGFTVRPGELVCKCCGAVVKCRSLSSYPTIAAMFKSHPQYLRLTTRGL